LIEHVFVLMLENRSFDHMLGFSSLAGTDAVSGEPTTVEGLTGGETNRLPSGEEIAVSAGADFSLTVDPPHNFDDVLEQLCGQGATYPDAAGRYPPITMSGFASRLAEQVDLDEVRTDLVEAVQRSVQPTHASVWLREQRP